MPSAVGAGEAVCRSRRATLQRRPPGRHIVVVPLAGKLAQEGERGCSGVKSDPEPIHGDAALVDMGIPAAKAFFCCSSQRIRAARSNGCSASRCWFNANLTT
jgi:hypothetical protein